MQLPAYPAIRLCIQPHFDNLGAASHLSVTYRLQTPPPQEQNDAKPTAYDGLRLFFETSYGNVPSHPYNPEDIRASDAAGPLRLEFVSSGGEQETNVQEWRPAEQSRCFQGEVKLCMDVWPRHVDSLTPLGPRVDLRRDHGGMLGSGRWFLPKPAVSFKTFVNVMEWDLSLAPANTRAIWSHGEGPSPIIVEGPVDTLLETVYMVGPVQSYPPGPRRSADPGFCGCYWLGDALPSNLDRLKDFNSALFTPMASMFHDGVVKGAYRVFVRRSERGFGGRGFRDSYVLEIDGSSKDEDGDDVRNLFAHEIVHSFALMDEEEDGDDNAWFTEDAFGLAELYSVMLPVRFDILSASYLVRCTNQKLSAYCTNPAINLSLSDAQRDFYSDWYAGGIPYQRGFVYLVRVDAQLREAAGITDILQPSPLDDIAIDFSRRREKGDKVLQQDWLRSLATWLDDSGVDYIGEFQAMKKGATVPLEHVFIGGRSNRLVATQQRVLQFGFDHQALSKRVVGEVVPGSRAEKAGLRVGDRIVLNSRAGLSEDDPEATYWLMIKREGSDQVQKLEWLPRNDRTVAVFQLKSYR